MPDLEVPPSPSHLISPSDHSSMPPADQPAKPQHVVVGEATKEVDLYEEVHTYPCGCMRAIDEGLAKVFQVIGRAAARNPGLFLAGSILFIAACMGGMSVKETESRPDTLWVPRDAIAHEHKAFVEKTWPSASRFNLYLTSCVHVTQRDDCNILSPYFLRIMFERYIAVHEIEVDGDKIVESFGEEKTTEIEDMYEGKWVYDWIGDKTEENGYRRKCQLRGPNCARGGIFEILQPFMDPVPMHEKPDFFDDMLLEDVLVAVNVYDTTSPVSIEKTLGGIRRDSDGKITGATHIIGFFEMGMSTPKDSTQDPLADKWEAWGLCRFGMPSSDDDITEETCPDKKMENIDSAFFFARSLGDEFGNAVRGDLGAIAIAYVLMMGYLVYMLGKKDSVHSMIALSFVQLGCVSFAVQAAMGFGFWCGIPETNLSSILYFLILGLGVDDAFVIVSEYNRMYKLYPELSFEEKVEKAVETGGMSIFVTSLTDATAFFIGMTTSIPALSWFCFNAGCAVVLVFLFQLTIFVPCLTYNARRTDANRYDCACCFKAPVEHKQFEPQGCCCPGCWTPTPRLPKLLDGIIGALLTPIGKVCVMLAFVTMCAVGFYGLTQLEADFDLNWFFPPGSYVLTFLDWSKTHFNNGEAANFYLDKKFKDETPATVIKCLRDLEAFSQSSKYFNTDIMSESWVSKYDTWATDEGKTDANLWANLFEFQEATGTNEFKFKNDVEADGIEAIRLTNGILKDKYVTNGTTKYATLVALREGATKACKHAFPYANSFMYWEESGVIMGEFVRNMILVAVVIFFIVFFMIPDLKVNVVVSFGVVMSVLSSVGFCWYWDLTVNGTMSVYVTMCVGLGVDYAAHIGHMFRYSNLKSGDGKSAETMGRIGSSVFNAIMSTLLAVAVLSQSKSYVFLVFFKVLCLVCVLTGLTGIFWLPVALSIVHGGSSGKEEDDKILALRAEREMQQTNGGPDKIVGEAVITPTFNDPNYVPDHIKELTGGYKESKGVKVKEAEENIIGDEDVVSL